jgi:phage baseplate assembly protein W
MRLILLLLPMQLITHPLPSVRVQKLEYSEHIRQKLNSILEIPEGRNYWEREFKTVNYENKLKEYLK